MPDLTSTGSADATPLTVGQSGGRLKALDVIRGVAILGILPVNMSFFSGPVFTPSPGAETWHGRLVGVAVMFLFELKMVTLLGVLFGAGLALLADRAQASGRRFGPYYLRRMLVLFLIGLCHALLLSHMDILTAYAVAGLIGLIFVRRSDRSLLRWTAALLTWCYGLVLLATVVVMLVGAMEFQNGASPGVQSAPAEQTEEELSAAEKEVFDAVENLFSAENEIRIFRQGSFRELLLHRAIYLGILAVIFAVWAGWYMLACMLIGMRLIRRGVFQQPGSQGPRFGKWIAFGLIWGLLSHLAANVAYLRDPEGMLYWCLLALGALPLAMAYLCILTLWAESGRLSWLQNRLQEIGRLALSNYLLQSVLCGFVFFGYGLGLYGRLEPAATMMVVLAVWAIQVLLSRWWLTRFEVGPAEWFWRSLSEGRRYAAGSR